VIRVQFSRIDINMTEANRLLNLPSGAVTRLVVETGRDVLRAVRSETPVMDGDMRALNAMVLRVRPFRHVMARIVNTDEAAYWVQTGTGIYGRRGRPIRPRQSRVLRFPDREAGSGFVYRRSVAGQRPNPFMLRGLIRGTSSGQQRWTILPGAGVRALR